MAVLKKTFLERFIESYLRQHRRGRNIKILFLNKTLTLINLKLGIPCCDDPSATINYHTTSDDTLTHSIRMMLNNFPPGYKASLIRSKAMIQAFIDNVANCGC